MDMKGKIISEMKCCCIVILGTDMQKHGTTHEETIIHFDRDEKASLIPLPTTRFENPLWKDFTVNPDHHMVFDKGYYSVATKGETSHD